MNQEIVAERTWWLRHAPVFDIARSDQGDHGLGVALPGWSQAELRVGDDGGEHDAHEALCVEDRRREGELEDAVGARTVGTCYVNTALASQTQTLGTLEEVAVN